MENIINHTATQCLGYVSETVVVRGAFHKKIYPVYDGSRFPSSSRWVTIVQMPGYWVEICDDKADYNSGRYMTEEEYRKFMSSNAPSEKSEEKVPHYVDGLKISKRQISWSWKKFESYGKAIDFIRTIYGEDIDDSSITFID